MAPFPTYVDIHSHKIDVLAAIIWILFIVAYFVVILWTEIYVSTFNIEKDTWYQISSPSTDVGNFQTLKQSFHTAAAETLCMHPFLYEFWYDAQGHHQYSGFHCAQLCDDNELHIGCINRHQLMVHSEQSHLTVLTYIEDTIYDYPSRHQSHTSKKILPWSPKHIFVNLAYGIEEDKRSFWRSLGFYSDAIESHSSTTNILTVMRDPKSNIIKIFHPGDIQVSLEEVLDSSVLIDSFEIDGTSVSRHDNKKPNAHYAKGPIPRLLGADIQIQLHCENFLPLDLKDDVDWDGPVCSMYFHYTGGNLHGFDVLVPVTSHGQIGLRNYRGITMSVKAYGYFWYISMKSIGLTFMFFFISSGIVAWLLRLVVTQLLGQYSHVYRQASVLNFNVFDYSKGVLARLLCNHLAFHQFGQIVNRAVLQVGDRITDYQDCGADGVVMAGTVLDTQKVMDDDPENVHIEVIWDTGERTTQDKKNWSHYWDFKEKAITLRVGDRVKAMPHNKHIVKGVDVYKAGDVGQILGFHVDGFIQVRWDRTQQTSNSNRIIRYPYDRTRAPEDIWFLHWTREVAVSSAQDDIKKSAPGHVKVLTKEIIAARISHAVAHDQMLKEKWEQSDDAIARMTTEDGMCKLKALSDLAYHAMLTPDEITKLSLPSAVSRKLQLIANPVCEMHWTSENLGVNQHQFMDACLADELIPLDDIAELFDENRPTRFLERFFADDRRIQQYQRYAKENVDEDPDTMAYFQHCFGEGLLDQNTLEKAAKIWEERRTRIDVGMVKLEKLKQEVHLARMEKPPTIITLPTTPSIAASAVIQVILDATEADASLGVDLLPEQDDDGVEVAVIDEIRNGLLLHWNAEHPDQEITEGDRIVLLNDSLKEFNAVQEELTKAKVHNLRIQKAEVSVRRKIGTQYRPRLDTSIVSSGKTLQDIGQVRERDDLERQINELSGKLTELGKDKSELELSLAPLQEKVIGTRHDIQELVSILVATRPIRGESSIENDTAIFLSRVLMGIDGDCLKCGTRNMGSDDSAAPRGFPTLRKNKFECEICGLNASSKKALELKSNGDDLLLNFRTPQPEEETDEEIEEAKPETPRIKVDKVEEPKAVEVKVKETVSTKLDHYASQYFDRLYGDSLLADRSGNLPL